MNREFKRRMKREQRQMDKAQGRQRAPIPVQSQQQRRERTGVRNYLREIQAELRRVMWPTRSEVMTYSVVVVFVVSVLTGIVFLLDLGFFELILKVYGPGHH